jgi:precorrin-2 dehydrogenase/sirohydrochlorin ferrochelatase
MYNDHLNAFMQPDISQTKATQETGNHLFPIFLKLEKLDTLVVGGGNVGLEKLEALLRNSPEARISLVADFIKEEIYALARKHRNVKLFKRKFTPQDLEDKDVVILATDSRPLHESIKELTRGKRVLTNVADTPDLCDFYLGSVVQKGDLKIAISTNGKSPTVAKRMRQYFEALLPDTMQDILDNMKKIRDSLQGDFNQKVKMLNEVTAMMTQDKNKSTEKENSAS